MRSSSACVIVIVAILCRSAVALATLDEQMEPLRELSKSMPIDLADVGQGLQRNFANLMHMPEQQLGKLTGRLKRGSSNELASESDELIVVKVMREMIEKPLKFFKESLDKVRSSEFVTGMKKFATKSIEAALRPVGKMLKKFEEIISPDACTLRTICTAGSNVDSLKEYLDVIPLNALEESVLFKALTKGIRGTMCEEAFVCVARKDKN